jgi:hypothetical protein
MRAPDSSKNSKDGAAESPGLGQFPFSNIFHQNKSLCFIPVVGVGLKRKCIFLIFAKMRKSCENRLIFAKTINFAKVFAKMKNLIKFDSDMACMMNAVPFFFT